MHQATIAELLQAFVELSSRQLEQTSMYIDILTKWNARINLTAVRKKAEIVARHFGESFFVAAQLLGPDSTLSLIDVGSGAGFPGLPIAIYAIEAMVTLIESNSKKAIFLREIIAALNLKNAEVFNGRAEAYRGTADIVTMRAVEKFGDALPKAANLVREGGRLALMIGDAQLALATEALPEMEWRPAQAVPNSASRVLAVGIKKVKVE